MFFPLFGLSSRRAGASFGRPVAFGAESDQIHLYMMPELEKCYQKNINVHKLLEDGTVVPRYLSLGHYDEGVHLNVWENHLSLILDFEKYERKYTCAFCHKCFRENTIGKGIRKCARV